MLTISIWCSDLHIGMIGVDDPDDPGPYLYHGSHIFPSSDGERGGMVDTAHIPGFLTATGYDPDGEDGPIPPWLRLSLNPAQDGEDTVVLDADQVRRLRDHLTWWLQAVQVGRTRPPQTLSDDPVVMLSLELGADPNIGMRTERAWQRVRRELEQHRTQRTAVLALHRDVGGGLGWGPPNGDHYGDHPTACSTCGTHDEYAVEWPCPTIRALGVES